MNAENKNNQDKTSNSEEKEEIRSGIKFLINDWIKNPILLIGGLVLGPLSLITALFVPIDNALWNWLQTFLFFIGVGFLILPFSYLFNLLWLQMIKDSDVKE